MAVLGVQNICGNGMGNSHNREERGYQYVVITSST